MSRSAFVYIEFRVFSSFSFSIRKAEEKSSSRVPFAVSRFLLLEINLRDFLLLLLLPSKSVIRLWFFFFLFPSYWKDVDTYIYTMLYRREKERGMYNREEKSRNCICKIWKWFANLCSSYNTTIVTKVFERFMYSWYYLTSIFCWTTFDNNLSRSTFHTVDQYRFCKITIYGIPYFHIIFLFLFIKKKLQIFELHSLPIIV